MFDKKKLEELMLRNWTTFLDSKRLMAKVLRDADETSGSFNIVKKRLEPKRTMAQISLSRCQMTKSGLVIWAEFFVPREKFACVGTAEYLIEDNGEITLRQMIGSKFQEGKRSTRLGDALQKETPS